MSLDNTNVVDAVGTEISTGVVVLSIMDYWDWSSEPQHLLALEAKMNAYFGFIESGQLIDEYPDASGRGVRIDILSRHEPPSAAIRWIEKANAAAKPLGVTITQRTI
jgi:hypothetical protein